MKSKPFVHPALEAEDQRRCTRSPPPLIAARVPIGVRLQVEERQTTRRCRLPDRMRVLRRGRVLRSRPSLRTKSTVTTVLVISSCDQPKAVCRVYGICRRGIQPTGRRAAARRGSAWFWLAMFAIGWPTR